MTRAWDEERRGLLEGLRRISDAGRGEGASKDRLAPSFYPVPEHLRMLDPDVVLVVGPRGSGKSLMARVLTEAALAQAVGRFVPRVRLPKSAEWVAAYPARRDQVFEGSGLKLFVRANGDDTDAMRDVWLAYLLRCLRDKLAVADQVAMQALWDPPAADVGAVLAAYHGLGAKTIVALDQLDHALETEGRSLFVTYDELDTLGHGDWKLIQAGVRGLVALWAAYTRRWTHLRGKLFLRSDLYERHARAGGADLYKLAASRVELRWSDLDLYAMLLKRMANADDKDLSEYVRSAGKSIDWQHDDAVGWLPRLTRSEDARPVIERMVGLYMGSNKQKGLVYRWLLDHVRDGAGRAYPRPLLVLVEKAAEQELGHFEPLRSPRLLQPAALRRALDGVSGDHVTQSRDEWPWIDKIRSALAPQPLVPYDEKEILRLLGPVADAPPEERPPFESRELLGYLVEIGVLRRRPDGRLDVPDLFLFGLGLRRKGGVGHRR